MSTVLHQQTPSTSEAAMPGPHSIRDLIRTLADLEDRLRALQPFVTLDGHLVVNPERRLLIGRQRRVVAALRARSFDRR